MIIKIDEILHEQDFVFLLTIATLENPLLFLSCIDRRAQMHVNNV